MDNSKFLQLSLICKIDQDMTIYDFIEQFQSSSSKLLCIINGITMHYYDYDNLPSDLCFTNKEDNKYYFVDNNINSYCVFGEEAAKRLYPDFYVVNVKSQEPNKIAKFNTINIPRLSDIQKVSVNNPILKIIITDQPDEIIITDKGNILTFPNCNPTLEIQNITD